MHEHTWVRLHKFDHENEWRERTMDRCNACGATRFGCFAKKTDADGQLAWGPVGKWTYSVREAS